MKRIFSFVFSLIILCSFVFAVEDPVIEVPAEDPVIEVPAEDPVIEVPAEDTVVEVLAVDPVIDAPSVDPVIDAPAEDPVIEAPAEDPVIEAPAEDPVFSGGGDIINEITEIYVMPSDIPVDATITDISVMSLAPITPSDTSGLKAVLLEVIGDYDPVIIEYAYENYNGSTAYLREVQPDYVWQGSLLLFGLIIYCLFRLGGALIRD